MALTWMFWSASASYAGQGTAGCGAPVHGTGGGEAWCMP